MLKSLNVAQSGLHAARVAVENASNNIANENTPGYKKRVVQLSELSLIDSRFTGRGVGAESAYRITSEYLFNNMLAQNTKNNYYEEISSIVGNVEKTFQETDDAGFSKDLTRFFQAIESLRANPSSTVHKSSLKTQGNVLVESLKNLYNGIEEQEKITRNRLESNVEEINSLLNEIGEINEQIGKQSTASNDLLDKRDELERKLSNLIDIDVRRDKDDYELRIGGAVAVRYNTNIREVNLVEEKTAQVDRFATEDSNGNAIDSILNGRTFDEDDIIAYKFNNSYEIKIAFGEQILDANGNAVDLGNGTNVVDETNYLRALKYKINHDENISSKVQAFNGNYDLDSNGNKIDKSDEDVFLVIESKIEGTEGSFDGRVTLIKDSDATYVSSKSVTGATLVDENSSLAAKGVNTKISIDGVTFTTVGENLASLASQISAHPSFSSASYDRNNQSLTITNSSGSVTINTAGKTYKEISSLIDANAGFTSSIPNDFKINGETFTTSGEDFASLASLINGSASFTASFNAGSNELTINGEVFSTAGKSYKDVAKLVNASASFTASTADRGTITVNVGGSDKVFTITDTMTYDDLVNLIDADADLEASLTSDGKLLIRNSDISDPITVRENLPTPIGLSKISAEREAIFKDEHQSVESKNKVYLAVYDSEITVKSGEVKAQVDNLTSDSPGNKIVDYKNKLNQLAKTLSDIYDKYVKSGDDYVYGHISTDGYTGAESNIKHLNLFSGSDIKTLQFNEAAVDDLNSEALDYLSKMQWKKDIDFDGFAQDASTHDKTSFSDFFQETKVNIASDKENNDFLFESQTAVYKSIESSHEQLTKVDNDEEQINLIQFQAAYTANAKVITIIDEMLQTLLGIRR